jgi:hypothetical protein
MKNALLTSLTAVGLALSLPAQAHSITSVGSGCDGTSPSTPLTLTSTAPVIGTTWSLTETNIPAGAFGMFFFGDTVIDPGIDLTSIGGTGCFIYTNANIGFQIASLSGSSSTLDVAIPASSSLVGSSLVVQATGGSSVLPLLFGTSNALNVTIGSV